MLVTINLIIILSLYLKKLSYYIFLAAFLQFPPKGRVPKLLNKSLCMRISFFIKIPLIVTAIFSHAVLTERINLPSLNNNLGSLRSKNLKTVRKISPLLRAEKLPLAFPMRPLFSSAFQSFKQS